MPLRAAHHRCRRRLNDLAVPPGTTPDGLARLLERRRGRTLHVVPQPPVPGVCGAWIATDDADFVYIDETATGVRRDHILAHELAHVALDHDESEAVLDDQLALDLFPDLDLDLVRSVLGRGRFDNAEEKEAEVLAWMLMRELEPGRVEDPPRATDVQLALMDAIGARQGPRA